MGGHGGLNILPQKKWNVYNYDNRAKVEEDEKLIHDTKARLQKDEEHKEFQHKISILRQGNNPNEPATNSASSQQYLGKRKSEIDPYQDDNRLYDLAKRDSRKEKRTQEDDIKKTFLTQINSENTHIQLFKIEEYNATNQLKDKETIDAIRDNQKIGEMLERYSKPWYTQRRQGVGPTPNRAVNSIRTNEAESKSTIDEKMHKKSHKEKKNKKHKKDKKHKSKHSDRKRESSPVSIEKLREERIKREAAERAKINRFKRENCL